MTREELYRKIEIYHIRKDIFAIGDNIPEDSARDVLLHDGALWKIYADGKPDGSYTDEGLANSVFFCALRLRQYGTLDTAITVQLLQNMGVARLHWSVGGGLPDEKLCLAKEGTQWQVYYSERGAKHGIRIFDGEAEACAAFLDKLDRYAGGK